MNLFKKSLLVVLLFVVFLGTRGSGDLQVTISNVIPRTDTNGVIMDLHDGNVLFINNTYYWYGASYGLCEEPAGPNGCSDASIGACGFQQNHNVSLYTSPNFQNWTFVGHVFSALDYPQPSVLFCPKVIYNAETQMYVLWANWIGASFADSYYSVATSPTAQGPFKLVVNQVTLGYEDIGDFSLFVDEDGTGYVIYTSHIQGYSVTHQMSVEQLTSDYTGTLGLGGNSGYFGDSFVEAPALFSANGLYYAVFGQCCCYCQSGSPVFVHTASSPLGPYTTATSPISAAISAQQTNIMSYYVAPGKYGYLWQGDRWQSAPDGIKGHDFVYMGELVFNGTEIEALPWDNSFTISIYTP